MRLVKFHDGRSGRLGRARVTAPVIDFGDLRAPDDESIDRESHDPELDGSQS